ncbi:hypothetical protein DMUE_1974 [Dictyocoela muelleri]|nr:hypothetical protein DMUE_1974 [Dictyocoela muelleri]
MYAARTPIHFNKNLPARQIHNNKNNKKNVDKIPIVNFTENKMGGQGRIIQIDETMLNFKCKSHRGRSTSNRTDALCIIELENGSISRVYATNIPNKEQTTLVPIIVYQVCPNSIIWTDSTVHMPVCANSIIHIIQYVISMNL